VNKVVHSSLLIVVLAIVAYGVTALLSGGADVWAAIRSLSLSTWVIILLLSLANYVLRYWRWHLYIQHNNPVAISHLQHLAIYIAGFSLTMTPGKAGEAMRSLYLKEKGVSHQRSIGALFVERVMDLLTILLMAGLGVSFLNGEQSRMAAVITVLLIFLCIVIVKIPKKKVINSTLVKRLPNKLYQLIVFVESMLENANDLLSIRFLCIGLGIGLVAWLCEGYGLYLVMQEFALDQSTVSIAIAIYGMAILLGALSFMPGGLGGAEVTMIFLLAKAGFDHPSAVAITFICRLATLWFAMLLGVIILFLMPLIGLKPYVKES
jgi:uncharacterized protein (TIRG00374 family)